MICPQCGTERGAWCGICLNGMCCCTLPIYDKDRNIQRNPETLKKHEEETKAKKEKA